jgi:AraC-like DNA-binding protein
MLSQESALGSIAVRIGTILADEYDVDPAPLYTAAGIDPEACSRPGARVSHEAIGQLWSSAVALAPDREFGLKMGRRARARDYYVLGYCWAASENLHDALQRMARYDKVRSTPYSSLELEKVGSVYRMTETFTDAVLEHIQPEAHDASYAALLSVMAESCGQPVYPSRLALLSPPEHHTPLHDEIFQIDIEFGATANVIEFPAELIEADLPGAAPAVADASERIAEDYIQEFESGTVATQVRSLLVRLLPAGRADQETIAGKLYRSPSTLQRQLSAEGTSFRDLLKETRQGLAEQYLKEGRHSQAEIAFMVGFSDQSNFARAFKRWTGESPGQFQRS